MGTFFLFYYLQILATFFKFAQKSDVDCNCKGDEALRGVIAKTSFFDGEEVSPTCIPYPENIYASKDLKPTKDIEPETEFKCPDGFAIFEMTWHIEDLLLKKFDVSCRKLKSDCIKKGKKGEVENSSMTLECQGHSVMTSFKAKNIAGVEYVVNSVCQELDMAKCVAKDVPGFG